MTQKLAHRGPDGSGVFFSEGISLGHRRLSIIDLSKNASQPMMDDGKKVVVVFNGEIYNFKEIKKDLIKKYKFKSESDTEVIIHGYKEYGENIFSKLNGMFAIAIWDWERISAPFL